MSEMGDWIKELNNRIATGRPVVSAPAPAVLGASPDPIATAAAAEPTPLPAPVEAPSGDLRNWLLQYVSGNNVLSPEMYQYFGGDEILRQVQQFDPAARWTQTAQYGGEAGDGPLGYRLDFDPSTLPKVGGPGQDKSIFETGFSPVYDNSQLHQADMVYDDPYFGKLTPYGNVVKEKDPWWTVAAPIAVGMLAPWAAGGLAAAGIGGAPGLTAAATGSGLTGGASTWWSKLLTKIPSIAKQVGSGNFNPVATAAGLGGSALGIPPELASLGASVIAAPKNSGYNPQSYNQAGSQKKPGSNDSQLVANDFAADPYGYSSGA